MSRGMRKSETHTRWRLVNPEPSFRFENGAVNPHPKDLSGKTIVLYWNGKLNGDLLLHRIGELLLERIPNVEVVRAWEVRPSTRQTDPTVEASRTLAAEIEGLQPDMVIGAPGDCAGSATWLISDLLNLERLGIPTVTVVTTPFLEIANSVSRAEGFCDACLVPVDAPIGMLSSSDIKKKAENAFDELLKAATDWRPSGPGLSGRAIYPAGTCEVYGTIEDVNNRFEEEKWSLGLPILPPTPERVHRMLEGIRRKPDEILGQFPPSMGLLTVELAAVYAVMAGCRPHYLPVFIAALEGFLSSDANLRLALTGSGTSQLLIVLNGPVAREIGISCGQGAAGKGHHANGSIGYAMNLAAYIAGGSRPPSIDRSTLASPSDYVCWVFGENEEALPDGWKPLHVENGFDDSDSVVTVMAAYPPVENMDHWSASVEEHLRWWGHIVSPLQNMGGPPIPLILNQSPIIALGPEHARLIASANWSKADFCRAFWRETRRPLSAWPSASRGERLVELLGPLGEDSPIPITLKPEQFLIVIAGGDGKQSHYFAPLPGSFPVSRLIQDRLSDQARSSGVAFLREESR